MAVFDVYNDTNIILDYYYYNIIILNLNLISLQLKSFENICIFFYFLKYNSFTHF